MTGFVLQGHVCEKTIVYKNMKRFDSLPSKIAQ